MNRRLQSLPAAGVARSGAAPERRGRERERSRKAHSRKAPAVRQRASIDGAGWAVGSRRFAFRRVRRGLPSPVIPSVPRDLESDVRSRAPVAGCGARHRWRTRSLAAFWLAGFGQRSRGANCGLHGTCATRRRRPISRVGASALRLCAPAQGDTPGRRFAEQRRDWGRRTGTSGAAFPAVLAGTAYHPAGSPPSAVRRRIRGGRRCASGRSPARSGHALRRRRR